MESTFEAVAVADAHERIMEEVAKAIEASDELRPFQKWRYTRRLRRPRIQAAIINEVMEQGVACGAVALTMDMPGEDGVEYIMVDWSQIIEIAMKYLPVLIQLIMLFL